MTKMQANKIFNPNWNDSISDRTIIKWNTTGLFNLNNTKYSWAKPMYQLMIWNFWVPEKVWWLAEDANQFKNELTKNEAKAYKAILSFLIFLDSIQTVNLPRISDYITAPEVNLLLAIQAYQESIHSQSYSVILETIVDSAERDEIYYFFRDDKILLERNTFIWSIYQDFIDKPNDWSFFKALVWNYLLEWIYFYNWFAFFDTLADNSKMVATDRMINYIRRDELTHVTIFANIFREIRNEFPKMFDSKLIYEMMEEAVSQEITWWKHIIGDKVIWMTNENIENYTKWLSNQRLTLIGLDPLYPKILNNPFKHLNRLQENNLEKWNFFESTVVNYTQSSSMNWSWDF